MKTLTTHIGAHRISEGTASAQRILAPRASLTADPYLLTTPNALHLHRIDTRHMSAPCHMVAGRTDEPAEHPADENQGRGLDHLYRGRTVSDRVRRAIVAEPTEHTEPEKAQGEHEPAALLRALVVYVLALLFALGAARLVAAWLAGSGV